VSGLEARSLEISSTHDTRPLARRRFCIYKNGPFVSFPDFPHYLVWNMYEKKKAYYKSLTLDSYTDVT